MGVACACIRHVSVFIITLHSKTYNSVLRSNKQWADLEWRLLLVSSEG